MDHVETRRSQSCPKASVKPGSAHAKISRSLFFRQCSLALKSFKVGAWCILVPARAADSPELAQGEPVRLRQGEVFVIDSCHAHRHGSTEEVFPCGCTPPWTQAEARGGSSAAGGQPGVGFPPAPEATCGLPAGVLRSARRLQALRDFRRASAGTEVCDPCVRLGGQDVVRGSLWTPRPGRL